MSTQNKHQNRSWVLSLLGTVLFLSTHASAQVHEFTTSQGLKLKVVQNEQMDYIHAQIAIYYNSKTLNPALPYFTYRHLFHKENNRDGSSILSYLSRLGNDYKVEHRADFLLLKMNFLPDRMTMFLQFLRALYRHRPFLWDTSNQESYQYSDQEKALIKLVRDNVSSYWRDFTDNPEWKCMVAQQIAYNKLFLPHPLGRTLITADALSRVNLTQIRAFYQDTYTPANSLVIIKGNLNPFITNGRFENAFKTFKKESPLKHFEEPLRTERKHETIILNINQADDPIVFWFEMLPPINHPDHIPLQIINNIVFGYPVGRLLQVAAQNNIPISTIETTVFQHSQAAVICHMIPTQFKHLERLLMLTNGEIQNLKIRGISRRSFLEAAKYFYGKLKITTIDPSQKATNEIIRSLFSTSPASYIPNSDQFQKITLSTINQRIENPRQTVVVIIGNSRLIQNNMRQYQATTLTLFQ